MGGQTGAPVGGPADGQTDRPTEGQTDGQTDRHGDRRTDRPTGGQTDGRTDRPAGGRTDGQTDRPTASPMARPPDRQTDRPTGGHTDRALDRRTDRPPADPPPAQWGSQAPPGPPTATINQQDLTDALRDPPPPPPGAPQPPGAAEAPPAPPVSLYLFPGEGGSRPHSGPTAAPPEPPPEPPPDPLGGSDSPDPDGFCILEAPPPPSPGSLSPPRVRWLQPGPLRVRDGHFGAPRGERDRLRPPPGLPPPRRRLLLRDARLDWQLFGGRDFGPGHAPHRSRRGGPAPSGPAPSGPAPSRWRNRGGPGRRPDLLMELHVGKVSVQHETYEEEEEEGGAGGAARGGPRGGVLAPGERPTARLVLLVPELELRDRLGGAAGPPFLCRHPRGGPPPQPPTLYIKALRVLPHPPPPGGVPECCLRVTLTPLRLHVDQDALIFLRDFASSFIEHLGPPTPPPRPPHAPPGPGDPPGLEPDEDPETEPLVYFREFRFTSEVPIWLDYRGKRVTMEQGALAGILIGLARLNCSRVRLKRLRHRQGLLGLRRVLLFALGSWLRDIRTHQLPGLLRGVAPLRAALRLGRALRELLLLPLVPLLGGPGGVPGGVTRGVSALGAASASAAIGLGSRLLRALQVLAEALYELVAPPSPPRLLAPPPETPADPPQSPPGARRSPAPPARDERPLPQ